jgi:hypothetical protein
MNTIFLNIITRLISEKTLNPKQHFFPKGYILLTQEEELEWGFQTFN